MKTSGNIRSIYRHSFSEWRPRRFHVSLWWIQQCKQNYLWLVSTSSYFWHPVIKVSLEIFFTLWTHKGDQKKCTSLFILLIRISRDFKALSHCDDNGIFVSLLLASWMGHSWRNFNGKMGIIATCSGFSSWTIFCQIWQPCVN